MQNQHAEDIFFGYPAVALGSGGVSAGDHRREDVPLRFPWLGAWLAWARFRMVSMCTVQSQGPYPCWYCFVLCIRGLRQRVGNRGRYRPCLCTGCVWHKRNGRRGLVPVAGSTVLTPEGAIHAGAVARGVSDGRKSQRGAFVAWLHRGNLADCRAMPGAAACASS